MNYEETWVIIVVPLNNLFYVVVINNIKYFYDKCQIGTISDMFYIKYDNNCQIGHMMKDGK